FFQYGKFFLVQRVWTPRFHGEFLRLEGDFLQNFVKLICRKRCRRTSAEVDVAKRNTLFLGKLQGTSYVCTQTFHIGLNILFHTLYFAACERTVTATCYAKGNTHVQIGCIGEVSQTALTLQNV